MTCQHSKFCPVSHQECDTAYRCGPGCYATPPQDAHDRATAAYVSRDFHAEPDSPVVSFDSFWLWLSGVVGTFIAIGALFNHEPPGLYRAYLVCIFSAVAYGLYRYFF
jgi:hypothetical protein